MTKITLHLKAKDGGPFNCSPARAVEIEPERILCGNMMLPHDSFNPHNIRMFVIGHEFGPVAAVFAGHDQDALDQMVDGALGDCFLVPKEDVEKATDEERECWASLGNAGEYANLDNAWIAEVEFKPERDWELIARLAEARGAGVDNLDEL